jgi:hypothetical protein
VEDGNDLKWGRLWPVNNGVVGIPAQRPKTEGMGCKVGPGVAARGAFREKRTSFIDSLFNSIRSSFAVLRNVSPYVEDIRFR